jgi:hypothetical protein
MICQFRHSYIRNNRSLYFNFLGTGTEGDESDQKGTRRVLSDVTFTGI